VADPNIVTADDLPRIDIMEIDLKERPKKAKIVSTENQNVNNIMRKGSIVVH
jgi:hypothetical protein